MNLEQCDTELIPPLGWTLRQVRAPLCDINETFLQLLIDLARLPAEPQSDFIAQLREQLKHLVEPVSVIAARAPVLLVDIKFRDREWWKRAATEAPKGRLPPSWMPALPRQRALIVTRATLTLAWHLARTDRDCCVVLLGMSVAVMDIMRALSLREVDRIAERQAGHLRPRWEDRPALWRQVLGAATDTPGLARALALRSLQLSFAPAPLRA